MDLNELKSSVLEQAKKAKELANTEKDLKNEIKSIIKKNFADIVYPFMKEMNSVIYKIHDLADVSISSSDEKKLYGNKNDCYITLKKYFGGVYPEFRLPATNLHNGVSRDLLNENWGSMNYTLHLDTWFLTEEDTQKFVDACKDVYVVVLNKYSELVKERNEKLSESIDKLSEELAKSSCVSHNKDGTVEIHLGGKTYTATLKESE